MDPVSFAFAALGTASVYAVVAVGVVLVYRTNKVLNFAVGETGVLCAYVFSSLHGGTSGTLALALGVTLAVAVAVGVALHLLVDRLGGRYGHFVGTVVTIAVATALTGIMSVAWKGEARRLVLVSGRVEILGASFPASGLLVILVGAAAVSAVLLLVRRTALGTRMQAVANSAALARLRGVPVGSTLLAAWIGSSLLAAIGAILMASLSAVALEGASIGVNAIVAAVLGGMFSVPGALAGAVLLAAGETLVTLLVDSRYSLVVPVLALVVLLAVRPSGLAGSGEKISRV